MAIDALDYGYDIVTFVKKYDVPTRLIPSVVRYRELIVIEIPSAAQLEELDLLAIELEPYNITANDYNNLFTAVQNVQTFITTDLQTYLDALFADYDARMTTMETDFNTQQTEIEAWYATVQANIVALQNFDFDNIVNMNGSTKEIAFNADGLTITTTIFITASSLQVARQVVTFNANGTITKQSTVYDIDGTTVLKSSTVTTTFVSNLLIREVIV